MKIQRHISLLVLLASIQVAAFGQQPMKQGAEAFILKVMREYKNPMAYYPLRKDIFLPTERELMKVELENSYPEGSVVLGSFIFIKNETYDREPFVDAKGNRLFERYPGKSRMLSVKGGSAYLRSKQNRLLNANPNLGRFLLYNSGFTTLR